MYTQILYEKKDGVGIISINRPQKHNALTATVLSEIVDVLDHAEHDETVGCILLRGEGKSFSAGYDISDDLEEEKAVSTFDRWTAWHKSDAKRYRLYYFPKPVVCAVKGYCLGGGAELSSLADIVLAAEDTTFALTELKLSIIPLPRMVYACNNVRHAKEMMMLAENFGAEDALRMGLINRVIPNDQLDDEAMRMARRLARLPYEPMQIIKKMCNEVMRIQGFETATEWGADMGLFSMLVKTKMREKFDSIAEREGMKAAFKWSNDYYDGIIDE